MPSRPKVSSGGAVVALLGQADSYRRAGDTGNEAATVERALRIEPKNARLWSRLAAIRLDQGQPQQAEQLALKSNSLAAGDRRLQSRNWQLVARARWSLNDSRGAQAAGRLALDAVRRIRRTVVGLVHLPAPVLAAIPADRAFPVELSRAPREGGFR